MFNQYISRQYVLGFRLQRDVYPSSLCKCCAFVNRSCDMFTTSGYYAKYEMRQRIWKIRLQLSLAAQ